jgi:hypothetical protein
MKAVSRRNWTVGTALALIPLSGCQKEKNLSCADDGALSEADRAARQAIEYQQSAPDPTRACERCVQWQESSDGCGGCTVVAGPIHPLGTCKLFAQA